MIKAFATLIKTILKKLFTISDFQSVMSAFLHNYNTINQKNFFVQGFNFETMDRNIINKYVIYKFNKYIAANTKHFSL